MISQIPTSAPDQSDRRGRQNRRIIEIQRQTATAQNPHITASLFESGDYNSRKKIAIHVQKNNEAGKTPGMESPDSGRGNIL